MKKHTQGFTLIEIMIALLLSTILIAAIGKIFIDSSNSFRKQKALSYIVQDGRYVMEMLAKELRRASFLRNKYGVGDAASVFIGDVDVLGSGLDFKKSEYIKGDFKAAGLNDAFDINHIIFRYQLNDVNDLGANNSDYGASPCTKDIHLTVGEDPATTRIFATLYLYVKLDDNSTPVLYCKAKRDTLDTASVITKTVSSPTAIPLISNVEKMYILYGVDTDNDDYANYYLRADKLSAADWLNVRSVRLYVVLGSEDKNLTQKIPSYMIEDRSYPVNSAADRRLYRVFSSTLAIRN